MNTPITLRPFLLLGALVLVAAGCGGGSGAATQTNPVTTTPSGSNYSGPAPATADVQSFKLQVWDNLVANNRCGSCHNADQAPRFVRSDDINLAYEAANTVVDLTDPGASVMVTKVRGGHNCWLTDDDACGDIIETYIANWAGDAYGGAGKTVQLVAPPLRDPGASKNYPADPSDFAATVYPLLDSFCADCHRESAAIPQSPYFASADIATAYAASQPRMDLDNPASSRFVVRLGAEFHNCWTGSCRNDADLMAERIQALSDLIPTTELDPDLVTSMALSLTDGIVSSAGGRHESNVIALYEFKTGTGNQVFDTSGVEPAVNLSLSGSYEWVGGWGVAFSDGKAQGSTSASAKLYNRILATGEFSVEAWVAPGNVTQDGPARIVTYSGGPGARNLMLGQTLYDYDSFVRSDATGPAGEPRLSTPDADEVLQATLQHVVLNYDPVNGRRIFVNGNLVSTADPVPGGLLNEWDDTYALAIGSEVDNSNRWAGTVRLLAIHNRALTEAQIQQNYDVGVGEKYYLLFNVSAHVGTEDAYVVFEVSQFDSYAYLFDAPFFVVLGDAGGPTGVPLAGLRIGLNGRVVNVGQAYSNLDVSLSTAAFDDEGRQTLSTRGTVIPLEQGPQQDEFFLSFERLGSASNVVVEASPAPRPPSPDLPLGPALGVRDFAEINATMAKLTGVPASHPQVAETYQLVAQAMPVQTDLGGFISSQQMGVTQLAIRYCSVLVDDPALRAAFWPGFTFGVSDTDPFADPGPVIDPIIDRMIGRGIATQPGEADVEAELADLIDDLTSCGTCSAAEIARVVKGACAAALGSAAMLVQ